MKAVVAAFNQEKALVGAFSVITNLRIDFVSSSTAHPHLGRHVAVVEGGVEDAGEADRQHRQQVGRQDAAPAHDTALCRGAPFIVLEASTGLHSVRRRPLLNNRPSIMIRIFAVCGQDKFKSTYRV